MHFKLSLLLFSPNLSLTNKNNNMKTKKLTFRAATDEEKNVGSWLVGYLNTTYKSLVKAFGKPSEDFDDYKSDAEWQVKFSDGSYVTIYNYKDGKNYNGASGVPKTKITGWHIGSDKDVSPEVAKALENATSGKYSNSRF